MKKAIQKLEALFSAIAFAEEGDVETARRIVADEQRDERGAGARERQAPEAPRPRRRRQRAP